MKYLLVILALVSGVVLSEESCDYSQEHQKDKLSKLAAAHENSKLDLEGRLVSWDLRNGGKIIYRYGGCAHIGHSVTLVEHLEKEPSEDEIFTKAQVLADEFWGEIDANHLKTALQSKKYVIEKVELEKYYVLEHPYFVEFNVIFEYQHNESRVTISSVD